MHISAVSAHVLVVKSFPAVHSQDIQKTNILPDDRVVPLVSQTQEAEIEDLQFAKKDILSFKKRSPHTLNFTVNKSSGEQVIQVVNPRTGRLVRQIQTGFLAGEILASRYQGNIVGYFLSAQA
jgi:uncharacterized FlaG/YvyC family protein